MLTAYGGVGAPAAVPCAYKYQRMCSAHEIRIKSKRIETRFGSSGSERGPAKRKEEVVGEKVSKLGRALCVRAMVDRKQHNMYKDSSRHH